MRYPTRTEITILAIVIAVLAGLGVRFQAWAATPVAPVMLTCPPGQSPHTTYTYTGGWSQPVETCGLDIIPGSGPMGLLATPAPEGITLPDFNQGGTLIQTVPQTLGQPEGITMPDFGTSGGVYANADSVYAQIAQPNTEEATCLNAGGIFSSNSLGSTCTYQPQPAGGVVEQPGTIVDTSGGTANQVGSVADQFGGQVQAVGNAAPSFSDEDAASAACVAGGNIYVYGQGCSIVEPMGGTVQQSSTVVDLIGSTAPDAGIPAPVLGQDGITPTYCAMAAGGFGACNPGGMVQSPVLGRTVVNGSTITINNGQIVGVGNVVGNGRIVGNNVVINNGTVTVDGQVVQTYDDSAGIRFTDVNGIKDVMYRNGVVTVGGVPVDPSTISQWSSGQTNTGTVITNVSTQNHFHGDVGDVSITQKVGYSQGNGYVKIDHRNGTCDYYYGCANIQTPNGYELRIRDGVNTGIFKQGPAVTQDASQTDQANNDAPNLTAVDTESNTSGATVEDSAATAQDSASGEPSARRSLVDRMRERKLRDAGGGD